MTLSDETSATIVTNKLRRKTQSDIIRDIEAAKVELYKSQLRLIEAKKDIKVVSTILNAIESLTGAFLCEIERNNELTRKLAESEMKNLKLMDKIKPYLDAL
jgi:hypothetical protein